MRKILVAVFAGLFLLSATLVALQQQDFSKVEIKAIPVRGNVSMLEAAAAMSVSPRVKTVCLLSIVNTRRSLKKLRPR